ncbi:MAG: hypothetical protein IJ756_05910 [Paludibacteraceae bacterium]|nr:hypothetical protein [Paludibacteraceae bacterium]
MITVQLTESQAALIAALANKVLDYSEEYAEGRYATNGSFLVSYDYEDRKDLCALANLLEDE